MSEIPEVNPDANSEKELMRKAITENLMECYGLNVDEADELVRGLREPNRTLEILMRAVSWQEESASRDCRELHEPHAIFRAQGEARGYKNVSRIGAAVRDLLSALYMQ